MTIDVVTIGTPALRRPVQQVIDFEAAREHCDMLAKGLEELKGAGLAANQIALDTNIFVAQVRKTELFPDREETGMHLRLNAEIYERSEEFVTDWEGCFSIPGYLGLVPRHSWIKVRYQDIDGNAHDETVHGYLARVFQHEIDHLAGHLYVDRMPDMLSFTTRENYMALVSSQRLKG